MPQKIITIGNPVLRKKSHPVERKDFGSKELLKIVKNLSDALRITSDGIGIAAPQIGLPRRIFIASEEALAIDQEAPQEDQKKKWEYYVYVNPEVIKKSAKKLKATEGCLSVPGKYGMVVRAEKIRVRAFDEHGKKFERGASGLFARLLQHEIDHLNGIVYIDRAEKIFDVHAK